MFIISSYGVTHVSNFDVFFEKSPKEGEEREEREEREEKEEREDTKETVAPKETEAPKKKQRKQKMSPRCLQEVPRMSPLKES